MARAMPSSTGLTASRCEGFAATETLILSPEPATNSPSAPRWYFTSPEPWTVRGSMLPSNSRKIWLYFLPTMLASMLSRPRWAMPMVTSSRPVSAAASQISSTSGMVVSPPSRLKRFCPTNLVCRKVSKASAWLSLSRIRSCSSRGGFTCGCSTRSWIHLRCSGSMMCMYSMPVVRQ